ncbi:MAG: LacI family DNA-binding transcriptional regulator [bacterium]
MSPNQNKRTKPVTLKDIAAYCGLGKSIVSYALRGDDCVKPSTKARILAAAAELGYDPQAQDAARRLVGYRIHKRMLNKMIAMVLGKNFYQGNYFGQMFRGVMDVLLPAGYDVVILHPMDSDVNPVLSSPSIRRGDIDGIITFSPGDLQEKDIIELRKHVSFRDRPIISLINPMATCSSVTIDDQKGVESAMTHLISLGHKHILQFVCTWAPTCEQRIQGAKNAYLTACMDPGKYLHHALVDHEWIGIDTPLKEGIAITFNPFDQNPHADTLVNYLREHPEITAIMAWNDNSAYHAWYQLKQAGVKIPEDISVIGYDDTDPILNSEKQNILTSVQLPLIGVGNEAARMIMEQLNNEQTEEEHVKLPTELIVRETTGRVKREE